MRLLDLLVGGEYLGGGGAGPFFDFNSFSSLMASSYMGGGKLREILFFTGIDGVMKEFLCFGVSMVSWTLMEEILRS